MVKYNSTESLEDARRLTEKVEPHIKRYINHIASLENVRKIMHQSEFMLLRNFIIFVFIHSPSDVYPMMKIFFRQTHFIHIGKLPVF